MTQPPETDPHRAIDAAEHAAAVMTDAGMPRMPARVMMALVAAPSGGYTAGELADRLAVSPAAISGAVKYLLNVRLVQRRAQRGDRLVRYAMERETFYTSVMSNTPVYDRIAALIDDIAAEHRGDNEASERATEIADFFRFLSRRMGEIVTEWHETRGKS